MQVRDSSGSAKGKVPVQVNSNTAANKPPFPGSKYDPYLEKAALLMLNERPDDLA